MVNYNEVNKIKVGFTVNKHLSLPAWEYDMLRSLTKLEFVELALISCEEKKSVKQSISYQLFRKFEDWWFKDLPDAHKEHRINPEEIKFLNETNEVSAFQPHLIYRSYNTVIPKELSQIPELGVWSMNFGKNQYRNSDSPAFWEVMRQQPVTGSTLEMEKEGERIILYDCVTSTVPFSVKNNLDHLAWKSASFIPLLIEKLYKTGAVAFIENHNPSSNNRSNINSSSQSIPGNWKMTGLFLRNCLRYFRNKLNKSSLNENFSIHITTAENILNKPDLSRSTQIPLPPGRFHADPFLIQKDGITYLFFEDFDAKAGKAHISVSEVKNNSYKEFTKVLDLPYHVSYPFVFEWRGEYYMVPETNVNRTVELYKAVQFPYEWQFVMNLMEDVIMIDTTLLFYNNKWWMFGNTIYHPKVSTNDQLLIFYSDDLFSMNWKPHARNPVVRDISNCRPAGRIFNIEGQLYRPAQNNASWRYGYGINLNRITTLNENDYREELVWDIKPEKGFSAIHHIDHSQNLLVFDAIKP